MSEPAITNNLEKDHRYGFQEREDSVCKLAKGPGPRIVEQKKKNVPKWTRIPHHRLKAVDLFL